MKPIAENTLTVFTTLDGQKIHFVPFSWDEYQLALAGLREEYRQRGEVIDRPQYTVKFASGTSQKFDHDEKSILQPPPDTPEEDIELVLAEQKKQWEAWLDTDKRFQEEDQKLLAAFVYEDSLASIKLPDDNSWEARQRRRHISIPDDPEEKRIHYINTVVLKAKSDQLDLLSTVVAVSMGMVKEADVEAIRRSFRDQIWGDLTKFLSRRDAAGKAEDTPVGKVGWQSPPDADPGSQTVAINEG